MIALIVDMLLIPARVAVMWVGRRAARLDDERAEWEARIAALNAQGWMCECGHTHDCPEDDRW